MAKFSLNIAAQVIIPYTAYNDTLPVESCSTSTLSTNVSMYNVDPEFNPTTPPIYLLNTYSGAAWKTLTISNIVYSDALNFYLEYLGTPMNINTVYNIDVLLLSPGVNIANLLIKSNITNGEITSDSISYDISITDINDVVHGSINSDVELLVTSCTAPIEPTVTDITDTATPPTEFIDFTINYSPYGVVPFQYIVVDKSTGGFSGKLSKLDAPHGNIVSLVSRLSTVLNTTFNILYNMGTESVAHFRLEVTTNAPNPPGPESDSFTDVNFLIRNIANTSTIQLLNIWIGETTAP